MAVALLLAGCVTESASRIERPFAPTQHRSVRIEPCEDRTGTAADRDLKTEATQALTAKIRDSGLFDVETELRRGVSTKKDLLADVGAEVAFGVLPNPRAPTPRASAPSFL